MWRNLRICVLFGLAASCAQEVEPATQIVLSIDSDLAPGTQLSEVSIEVLAGDGDETGRIIIPPIAIAKDAHDAQLNRKVQLPLHFPILPGDARRVQIRVVGSGVHRSAPSIRELVAQRAIVSFQPRETQLVRVYLGTVCVDQRCDAQPEQVCYPTSLAGVAAGLCGSVQTLSASQTLSGVDPADLPGLVARAAPASDAGVPNSFTGDDEAGAPREEDASDAAPSSTASPPDAGRATPPSRASMPRNDAGMTSSRPPSANDAGSTGSRCSDAGPSNPSSTAATCIAACPAREADANAWARCYGECMSEFNRTISCLGESSSVLVSK